MRIFAIFLASAVGAAACSAQSEAPVEAQASGLERAGAPGGEFDLERERALKESGLRGGLQTQVVPIDWAEAAGSEVLPADVAPATLRAEFSEVAIPALVPARADLLAGATLTHGDTWYAVSMDGPGHTVYVSGSNLEVVVPQLADVLKRHPGLGGDFLLTRNEALVTLSFGAFGASYVVEIECADPLADPRCVEDDYAIELANSLVLANPGGGK